jgi:hypothetical protein
LDRSRAIAAIVRRSGIFPLPCCRAADKNERDKAANEEAFDPLLHGTPAWATTGTPPANACRSIAVNYSLYAKRSTLRGLAALQGPDDDCDSAVGIQCCARLQSIRIREMPIGARPAV